MSCNTVKWNTFGISKCLAFESPLKNVLFFPENNGLIDFSAINDKEEWLDVIQNDGAFMPVGLAGYEIIGEDPTFNTTQLGRKFLVKHGKPALRLKLEGNQYDYQTLLKEWANGAKGKIYLLLEDGTIKGTNNEKDSLKPFSATFYAYTKGVNVTDAPENYYIVDVYFDDYEEFSKYGYLHKPPFNVHIEFPAALPESAILIQVGNYVVSGTKVYVKVTSTNGNAIPNLTNSDFRSDTAGVSVDAVAYQSDGRYEVSMSGVDTIGEFDLKVSSSNFVSNTITVLK